ncbi:hypothetical protein CR51_05710 [Caballeronia megalochromosomata]|nr:hypothetical protein CR51_05710 [Caballeronia megalochromosomata]
MTPKYAPKTANEKSIVALARLIESVSKSAGEYAEDAQLLSALKRQSRLGQFSRDKLGIAPTSRCTIERVSNRIFEGGFARFDEERRGALSRLQAAIAEHERPARRTKASVQVQLESAEIKHVQALVDCWHLTNAFHESLKRARALVNLTRDPALVQHWDKQEDVLLAMFDMAERPVVKTKTEAEKWLKRLRS